MTRDMVNGLPQSEEGLDSSGPDQPEACLTCMHALCLVLDSWTPDFPCREPQAGYWPLSE